MRILAASWCLLLAACAGGGGGRPAEPAKKGPVAGSLSEPILRCGPRDSYAYVANRFQCADGANPFAGDVRAAARSRSGAQRSPTTGHLLDTYEVPCKGGTVTVYIDMYGCEEYRKLVASPSQELKEIQGGFDAGEYRAILARCAEILNGGKPPDAFSWCGIVVPATLVLLGDERAPLAMKQTCDPMPPHGDKSDARLSAVELAMIALARGSARAGPEIDVRVAERVLVAFSVACDVDPRDVVRRLSAESA
jgi:hypothetical protein